MDKPRKIIIDLIVVNICNKLCDYCCIKFNWKRLEKPNIDFLINYLEKNKDNYDDCLINFFWGEPLLNFEAIKYFIETNKNEKITYNLWTNWLLFTEDKLNFLNKHNVKIYLSFHSDEKNTYNKLLEKTFLKKNENIEVNFIVAPSSVDECYKKLEKAVLFWYKRINIIPVMLTKKWEMSSIKELSKFIDFVDETYIKSWNYNDLIISKFSFFDWIIQEKIFIIDRNLNIFQDSSDELYIWKQFDKLWKKLSEEIEKWTFLGNLKDENKSFLDIINSHSVKKVFNLIYKLPKKMDYVKDYYLIYKIMNKTKQEEKRGSYMIFWVN